MPTNKPIIHRYYFCGHVVYEQRASHDFAICHARGYDVERDSEKIAKEIAAALNAAAYCRWTGEGPAVEEVGEDVILAWDGRGWNYAVFEGDPAIWWWRDSGEPVLDSASHWRRVPKAPTEG